VVLKSDPNQVSRGEEVPTTALNLDQIQGNSIGGFNKDFQTNLFLKFTGDAAGRAWIKEISEEVAASSSADVRKFNNQFSALIAQGVNRPQELISAVWVNLALSFQGPKRKGTRSRGVSAGISRRHGETKNRVGRC
jgi:hypothetical protein